MTIDHLYANAEQVELEVFFQLLEDTQIERRVDVESRIINEYEHERRGYITIYRIGETTFGWREGGDFPFTSRKYYIVKED